MNNTKLVLEKLSRNTNVIKYIVYSIIITVVVLIIIWLIRVNNRENSNCKDLEKRYANFPKMSSVDLMSLKNKYNLRDFYVKSAYNACSPGNYKSDFVSLCALKTAIKQGYRFLDFQVYSLNNKPVIATSSVNDYYTKGSYNSVDFADAMNTVSLTAFSGSTCPNPNDPLMLNFRVFSNNKQIYDIMAKTIYDTLQSRMLGNSFSYENKGKNLGMTPIKKLMGKVIICVDKKNPLFVQTKLNEYVNVSSNSVFMRSYTFSQLKNIQDFQELLEFNKKNMTIVIPDTSSNYKHEPSPALAMKYGCQFVAMPIQSTTSYLDYYKSLFEKDNSAFILKPEDQRFTPVTVAPPKPANPAYSYQTRQISQPHYNMKI